MENLSFEKTRITGGFWKFYHDLNRESIVKNVYDRYLETGRFEALKCLWRDGVENKPHIFWDSDVMKWIEGVAYLTQMSPEPDLEALVDEMAENIAKNQRGDGYFNSYFLTVEPEAVFKRRDDHELYCLGHAIEAAIAYHKATGKKTLLECVLKYTDLVYRIFLKEESAGFTTPGHQEIELALLKLYDYTGDEKHLDLARYFIDQRGNNYKEKKCNNNIAYNQSDKPVREMTEAYGHAVRACYLYTAMALLSKADGDTSLKDACERIYDDIITSKLSITGGVGADHRFEDFSYKYNLPNRDTYNETCAAISLALFSHAMGAIEMKSSYGDVIERILYNGFISGVSLDGEKFFYSNPLEVDTKKYAHSTYQTWCERMKSFDCSCCPPNVVRMLGSVSRFMYSVDDDNIYCNQFATCETELWVGGERASLSQTTDYPFSGKITFKYSGKPCMLSVRIPDWCVEYEGKTDNGYTCFYVSDGDVVTVDLPMNVHFMESDPRVQDNSGRYAVQRGPLVYCMEGVDNGENLRDITLIEKGGMRVEREEGIPAPVIYMDAERRKVGRGLYSLKNNERKGFTARLIPYFAFANREITDMIVWTMVK